MVPICAPGAGVHLMSGNGLLVFGSRIARLQGHAKKAGRLQLNVRDCDLHRMLSHASRTRVILIGFRAVHSNRVDSGINNGAKIPPPGIIVFVAYLCALLPVVLTLPGGSSASLFDLHLRSSRPLPAFALLFSTLFFFFAHLRNLLSRRLLF